MYIMELILRLAWRHLLTGYTRYDTFCNGDNAENIFSQFLLFLYETISVDIYQDIPVNFHPKETSVRFILRNSNSS